MAAVELKALVGKLAELPRRALETAAGQTLRRTHYNVKLEHWLLALMDRQDGDVYPILQRFEIDAGRLGAELNRALDRLKTGNARPPGLSPDLVEWTK